MRGLLAVVILGNLVSETSRGILHVFGKFRRQSILAAAGKTITIVVTAVTVMANFLSDLAVAFVEPQSS